VKILLTRPAAQAQATANLLNGSGIETSCFAVQRMESTLPEALQAATAAIFADAAPIHGFIFISANAVEFGWPWLKDLSLSRCYCVGAATTQALRSRLIQAVEIIQPENQFDSEGLLAMPQLVNVSGQRLIIIRGLGLTLGRDLLGSVLRQRGARVEDAFCYIRTVESADNMDFSAIQAQLNTGEITLINVQSGETLSAFVTLFAPTLKQYENWRLLVPHHRIAALAAKSGFKRVEVTGVGDNCLKSYLIHEASHGNHA
jgi:uroporphyrinogen-III synthase